MRHPFRLTSSGLLGVCLAAGLLAPGLAAAQGSTLSQVTKPIAEPNAPKAREAAPPALPGARASSGSAALPDRPTSDMAPTEALFDGINRGDIGTVRDALARGADIGVQNVLGLTPIDLSVDLGRNEITFLLLSMRGAVSASGPNPRGGPAPARPGARPTPATRAAAAEMRPRTPIRAVASESEAPVSRQPAGRQYSNRDPGAPAPQAGFLGFGGAPGR